MTWRENSVPATLGLIVLLVAMQAQPSAEWARLQAALWPQPAPPVASPVPPATQPPKPRATAPAAPAVAPAVKPTKLVVKPKAKPTVKPKPQHKPAVARPTPPPPGMCSQIAFGIGILGREGVKREAKARGYTNSQIAKAQAACGY
jgi:protein TonB